MADVIRAHDWASTPLGPIHEWPQSLCVAVRLILGSRQPMFIWWGPHFIRLYNDACVAIVGPERHPQILGGSGPRDPTSLWLAVGEQIEQVMAGGEATWHENAIVPVFRQGRWTDARWDYGLSPIDEPSASNGVGGVLAICKDVTDQHAQREALRASEARLQAAVDLVGLCPHAVDLATGTREWDAKLKAIWGLPPSAHVDTTVFLSGIHPDDRARVQTALAARTDPNGDGIYHLEYRVIGIEDRIERWVSVHGQTTFQEGRPVNFVGAVLDITERKRAEKRLRLSEKRLHLLVAELQHRTRNLLGVVSSMSTGTLASSVSLEEFGSRFQARLEAIARANSLLSRLHGVEGITFGVLLRMELSAHGALDDGRAGPQVGLKGPEGVQLRASVVQTLALGLHELATNALKYGALSRPEGRLRVQWDIQGGTEGERQLWIEWEETGVPVRLGEDAQPPHRGYGRELIEQALPYQLGAETSYELHRDGLRCTISLPLEPTRQEIGEPPAMNPQSRLPLSSLV
ncbi:sensor histidine kinase [Muricoccus vinaceus]|uniref:histidine kinase n=1 Tax=Muricoccus vinaceus TaxID=424704 RepID=A0ABV6IL49_9PROT